MSSVAFISAANRARIRRAEAWLEGRPAAEELLIVGQLSMRPTSSHAKSPRGSGPRLRCRNFALAARQRDNPGGLGAYASCVEPSEAASLTNVMFSQTPGSVFSQDDPLFRVINRAPRSPSKSFAAPR